MDMEEIERERVIAVLTSEPGRPWGHRVKWMSYVTISSGCLCVSPQGLCGLCLCWLVYVWLIHVFLCLYLFEADDALPMGGAIQVHDLALATL
jgi:hypothetical protein